MRTPIRSRWSSLPLLLLLLHSSAQVIQPVTDDQCTSCCALAQPITGLDLQTCESIGCLAPFEDRTEASACAALFSNEERRRGCEVGRDFKFLGVSALVDPDENVVRCDFENQDTALVEIQVSTPISRDLLSLAQCEDCCVAVNAAVDGGGDDPDDFEIDSCEDACQNTPAREWFEEAGHRERFGRLVSFELQSTGQVLIAGNLATCDTSGDVVLTLTQAPTFFPSVSPSRSPSTFPTVSPSPQPSSAPSDSPTRFPTTSSPSTSPTTSPSFLPTQQPSTKPTSSPLQAGETATPTTAAPIVQPSTGPEEDVIDPGDEEEGDDDDLLGSEEVIIAGGILGASCLICTLVCLLVVLRRQRRKPSVHQIKHYEDDIRSGLTAGTGVSVPSGVTIQLHFPDGQVPAGLDLTQPGQVTDFIQQNLSPKGSVPYPPGLNSPRPPGLGYTQSSEVSRGQNSRPGLGGRGQVNPSPKVSFLENIDESSAFSPVSGGRGELPDTLQRRPKDRENKNYKMNEQSFESMPDF